MEKIPAKQLLGQTTEHLATFGNSDIKVHRAVVTPLQQLTDNAAREGITLRVASGFRSFERQLAIWNSKASGERPVLDDSGTPVDLRALDDTSKLWAILRWSALPGASRHHWGTDIDVWDTANVPDDYKLQLTPEEYTEDGPFAHLSNWLTKYTAQNNAFTRPYNTDTGGTAPEPWHLSFQAVAIKYQQQLTVEQLAAALQKSDITLKDAILDNIEEIFARFILC